jgi:tubulin polyglutamylase TTLL1
MAPPAPAPLLWRSDFDKFVVTANFQRRGWQRWHANHDLDWNVYWANVHTTREIFAPENGIRLGEHQRVNHFPNHYELTRKDLLVKNVKRYRKDLEREAIRAGEDPSVASRNASSAVDFLPATFALPGEYALFAEAFRKETETEASPTTKANVTVSARSSSRSRVTSARGFSSSPRRRKHPTWIMKPTGKAQGKGIFLINSLQQTKRWANASVANAHDGVCTKGEEAYVVSRYVDDPLLIGGYKFDLRLYVVVTRFRPLRAFVSRLGFARFCAAKYVSPRSESGDLGDHYAHLTNVAVQKKNAQYNAAHGGKWSLENLRLFLESARGAEATARLWRELDAVILKSLRAVQNIMHNDAHCFELYGYDMLIDASLKPWLIEVNASPSLSATTEDDRDAKLAVIRDALAAAVPESFGESAPGAERPGPENESAATTSVGSLDLLVDDAADAAARERARERRDRGASRWARERNR